MANFRRFSFDVAGGAIAETFAPSGPVWLEGLLVHVSAAPTTSGSFTVTLDSRLGAAYDTVLYSINLATASTTDVFNNDLRLLLEAGDALDIAYANADGRTIGVQLIFQSAT